MRVVLLVLVLLVLLVLRRVGLIFPPPPIVQLHPVILAILHFSGVLQCLCEEIPQVVVIGRVLETEIPDVGQILAELLCVRLLADRLSMRRE